MDFITTEFEQSGWHNRNNARSNDFQGGYPNNTGAGRNYPQQQRPNQYGNSNRSHQFQDQASRNNNMGNFNRGMEGHYQRNNQPNQSYNEVQYRDNRGGNYGEQNKRGFGGNNRGNIGGGFGGGNNRPNLGRNNMGNSGQQNEGRTGRAYRNDRANNNFDYQNHKMNADQAVQYGSSQQHGYQNRNNQQYNSNYQKYSPQGQQIIQSVSSPFENVEDSGPGREQFNGNRASPDGGRKGDKHYRGGRLQANQRSYTQNYHDASQGYNNRGFDGTRFNLNENNNGQNQRRYHPFNTGNRSFGSQRFNNSQEGQIFNKSQEGPNHNNFRPSQYNSGRNSHQQRNNYSSGSYQQNNRGNNMPGQQLDVLKQIADQNIEIKNYEGIKIPHQLRQDCRNRHFVQNIDKSANRAKYCADDMHMFEGRKATHIQAGEDSTFFRFSQLRRTDDKQGLLVIGFETATGMKYGVFERHGQNLSRKLTQGRADQYRI